MPGMGTRILDQTIEQSCSRSESLPHPLAREMRIRVVFHNPFARSRDAAEFSRQADQTGQRVLFGMRHGGLVGHEPRLPLGRSKSRPVFAPYGGRNAKLDQPILTRWNATAGLCSSANQVKDVLPIHRSPKFAPADDDPSGLRLTGQ